MEKACVCVCGGGGGKDRGCLVTEVPERQHDVTSDGRPQYCSRNAVGNTGDSYRTLGSGRQAELLKS